MGTNSPVGLQGLGVELQQLVVLGDFQDIHHRLFLREGSIDGVVGLSVGHKM